MVSPEDRSLSLILAVLLSLCVIRRRVAQLQPGCETTSVVRLQLLPLEVELLEAAVLLGSVWLLHGLWGHILLLLGVLHQV